MNCTEWYRHEQDPPLALLPSAPCSGITHSLIWELAYGVYSQAFEITLALPPAMKWVGGTLELCPETLLRWISRPLLWRSPPWLPDIQRSQYISFLTFITVYSYGIIYLIICLISISSAGYKPRSACLFFHLIFVCLPIFFNDIYWFIF